MICVILTPCYAQTSQLGPLVDGDGFGIGDFGHSVSLHQSRILVGAPRYGATSMDARDRGPGAAFVFENIDGHWMQSKLLAPSVLQGRNDFGFSVAIKDDLAIVGTPSYGSDNFNEGIGTAFIFRKESEGWVFEQQLSPAHGEFGDYFGTAVAIGNGFIAVSSPEREISDTSSGMIYLFTHDGDKWIESEQVSHEWKYFGDSMDASNSHLIVGTHGLSHYAGGQVGHAMILDIENGLVVKRHELNANPNSSTEGLGHSVAIDGMMAVVGVPSVDIVLDPTNIWNGQNAGAVYVFEFNGFDWEHTQTVIAEDPGTSDKFGWSVDIANNRLIAGSIGEGVLGNVHGSAYVFENLGGELRQIKKLKPEPGETNMKYGWSVAINQGYTVVATPNLGGHGFVYDSSLIVGREQKADLPTSILSIESLSPNPFAKTVTLEVVNAKNEAIYFDVFDSLGRKVHSDNLKPDGIGRRKITWDPEFSRSGVYYFMVSSQSASATLSGVLVK